MNNKKLLKQLVIASSMSLVSLASVNAAVNLQVDDHVKVTVINGEEVSTGIFQEPKKSFTLQPGKHVITAKYDRLYDLRHDEHDYLHSANVTVTADMQDNQTYRLTMLGQPEKYEEAREYAKAPTLAVVKGSNVIAEARGSESSGGLFSGITSIFGGGDAQADNQRAIAAINSQPSTTTVSNNRTVSAAPVAAVSTPARSNGSNAPANANTLDSFMQLWLQASPQEREKIRQWVDQ